MTDVKAIRKNLKEKLGYNARMVSVSQKSSTINFTIRDEKVDYNKLKDFTKSCESISYDEATQCILRGGNTLTGIKFSDPVRESLTNKHLAAVEKAISNIIGQYLEDVEGTDYMIDKALNGFNLWVKRDDCGTYLTECHSPKELAFNIALGK